MTILVFSINDALGGAELYLRTIARQYKHEDLDIAFLRATNRDNWQEFEGQATLKAYSKSSKFLGIIRFIWRSFFIRKQYDYIFTSHIHTNALIGLLRTLGLVKTNYHICRESTSIFLRFRGLSLYTYKMMYALGYKNIDLIICQTRLMKRQLLDHFKRLRRFNVEVIPNPIELDVIQELAAAPSKYDFDYIVAAGRLIHVKGFDILIKAFSQFKVTYPNMKLVLLGEGQDREKLGQLAHAQNVFNDVIFEGHVNNVIPYFKNAKICVVSSRIEGFPNVLLQMMSQNDNVVSTTCAGGIDRIQGVYTCQPSSVSDLSLALSNCFESNNQALRNVFDDYLLKRDVKSFMKQVIAHLNHN